MLTTIEGLSDANDFLFTLPVEGGAPVEISFGKNDDIPAIRELLGAHGWYAFLATNARTVVPIHMSDTAYLVEFDNGGRPHHKKLILVKKGFVGERGKSGPFTQYRVDSGEGGISCTNLGTYPTLGGDMKARVVEMITRIAETGLGEEFAWQVFNEVGLNAKSVVAGCKSLIAQYCDNSREQLTATMDAAWAAGDPFTDEGLPKACEYILHVAGWRVRFDNTVRVYFRIFKKLMEPEVEWRWVQTTAAQPKRAVA